ncbi:MAG: family 78 glycoside hydrolase catalytic domain [Bacteroidales bacterium]|nr:family 78 glycoside hydrolase catalytic domain [Bacteroidales bacterium]
MNRLSIAAFALLVFFVSCTDKAGIAGRLTDPIEGADAWNGSCWISAADAPVIEGGRLKSIRAADGASWFVSGIKNGKEVASARWMTAGLGVYQLYVNGLTIGEEVLKPGFTHPRKTKRSFTYDITDALKKRSGEENVIAAQVTPGWWADKIVSPGNDGMVGRRCAFRSVLEITYKDGSKEVMCTDTLNWRAGIAGPVKHAGIFDGEEYDARELPGYLTADKLGTPIVNREFKGEILPTDGAEIYHRHDLALKPAAAYVWKNVEGETEDEYGTVVVEREYSDGETMTLSEGEKLVIDFGQNCAAVPSFVFKAAEGVKLTCLPGEILNDGNGAHSRGMDGPQGSVHRRNLRIQDVGVRLDYTFAGDKDFVTYIPLCTFFGYRYISLTATSDVTIKSVLSVPVTSISKELEAGVITTGNELVNKLISNTVWGQRSNYLSVPTDCPQRDERLGWTADTQVFSETGTFFANTSRFFHKWMRDMRDTQSELGGFPGVAPAAQYGAAPNAMMRLGWADAGVIVPWTVWKQFGDTEIVNENWDAMSLFFNHITETKYSHEALKAENDNFQWADWLSYEPLESASGRIKEVGPDGKYRLRPETLHYWNYLCASYWAIDAGMMRDMAAATGRDAGAYEAILKEAVEYLKANFLDNDGNFKLDILNTMQTPALFALKNNLVDGEAKANMVRRLRQNFADHDGCLQTGFLGTSILLQTLTDNGMVDVAYELLFQRKNPSWLYSVDNGATTIWERWNSYTVEKGMGPKGMNSFNHYAYGCVCEWIWETAAGIAADPQDAGFRHIIMKPVPDRRLGHLEARYNSAAGIIESSWRYEGEDWLWDFTIPEGSTATVTLPGESESKEYGPGRHSVKVRI